MTIIDPGMPDSAVAEQMADPELQLSPEDTERLAFLDWLKPHLLEIAKATKEETLASIAMPVIRPGTVKGVTAEERTVSVQVDGDTSEIPAQVIIPDLPGVEDRVMVLFQPPSAVFICGINRSAVPPGTMFDYAGPITAHRGAASSSATLGQPPPGFLWCAGQAVSRATYAALFAAIGTTYGSGDGSTTFNVPDARGRIMVALDNMGGSDAGRLSVSNTLGGTGGAQTHTLATTNLPSHNHDLGSHTHTATPSLSVSSHTHDLGNHTHSGSGLSVSSHSHTISGSGTHQHGSPGGFWFAEFNMGQDLGAGAATGTGIAGYSQNTGTGGDHSHGGSTGSATPGVSGNTGTPSSNTSGSASPSVTGTVSIGAASGNTGSTGSGTAVDHMPPYMLVHKIIKF